MVLTFVCGFESVIQWPSNVGKWGPNEKSVMTCERSISKGDVSPDVEEEGRTYGYGLHVHNRG